ncbi:trehalose-phosphatase [Patulibacter sp.]|uniref:trehalose-phosphatase n=1 Tax=Patulibacter sp. TaxID=1912859 RepID=UPI0027214205|nr:trehalose-phosphatase [Patulibacter sp.]MDO9410268.1 trehalose-phosphatase [Patulibacter sp.]
MIDDRLGDLLAPLRATPGRTAVLLDVDGTLAPITTRASDVAVPEATRAVVADLASRFGLVACITGRRTVEARAIVGVDGLEYVGNHGTEILRSGADEAEVRPGIAEWEPRVRETADRLLAAASGAGAADLRLEDKGPIQAIHWRGAADEPAAEVAAEEVGRLAEADGLVLHRGRMVLELRPPVPFDKGAAVRWVLEGRDADAALYAGDDRTDVDAFEGLRALRSAGELTHVVCVAAVDPDSPPAVAEAADASVEGTDGVRSLLQELARP